MAQKRFYKREELIGKQVVNQDGNIVGTVKETGYDAEGRMAIIVQTKDGKEQYYSIADIRGIGDVVILRENAGLPTPASVGGVVCPYCGYVNPPGSLFCMKCGSKIA